MHLSRKLQSTVHHLIVAGTALRLAGGLDAPAAHAHDDPPLAPVASPTTKSPTPAVSNPTSVVPKAAPTLLASDVYIDVKPPRIVDGVSDADLGTNVAAALRESLALSAKRQHIADPTARDRTAPKALHLTLEEEVGMIEVGEKLHRPCMLTMRLYSEREKGEKRQLIAQFSGTTRSQRELTRRFYPDSDIPLVAKMAPRILDAAMNAALGSILETLTHPPDAQAEVATSHASDAHALAAAQPRLNITIQHLDKEAGGAIDPIKSSDAHHSNVLSALNDPMEVAPGHHYCVDLTSPEEGTVYLISLNPETMLPTFVDSPLPVLPNHLIQLPAKTPLISPENPGEVKEQIFFAVLQKRREPTSITASHPSTLSLTPSIETAPAPSMPAADKKPKQSMTSSIAVNTILSSASVPIFDTLDPAIVRLVHLYTADPEGWTAMRVTVTTTPVAPPDDSPAVPAAKSVASPPVPSLVPQGVPK